MAVRFSASTDVYTATTGLPTGNVYTVICWMNIRVSRATWSDAWGLGNGTVGVWLGTDSTGVNLYAWDNGTLNNYGGFTGAVGTWVKTAITVNGATTNFYREFEGNALAVVSATTLTPPNPPTALTIGNRPGNTEWMNGSVANFKLYNVVLTQAEIETELADFDAIRTANLIRHHKFHVPELTDYSGNGNSLTAGSTAPTTDTDPSIPDSSGFVPYAPPTDIPANIVIDPASVGHPVVAVTQAGG